MHPFAVALLIGARGAPTIESNGETMTITAKEIRFALDGVITELKNVATTSDLAAIVAESASKYITKDQAKDSLDAAIADAMSEIKGDLQKQSEKGAMAVDDLAEQLDQITASLDLINTTHLDAVSSAAEVSGAIFDEVQALKTVVNSLDEWRKAVVSSDKPRDPAKSCKDHNLEAGEDGLYEIQPEGASGNTFKAYCVTLPETGSVLPVWTVIASQPGAFPRANWKIMYNAAPTPLTGGAVEYYWTTDLKSFASDIYVSNNKGDHHVFDLDDFDQGNALVLSGRKNFLASGASKNVGILSGSNYPVHFHYQVGAKGGAQSGGEFKTDLTMNGGSYSYGLMAVFDWHEGDDTMTLTDTAAFGGKSALYGRWSSPGTLLAFR